MSILRIEMGNGATVSDWLGTAASAGRVAANYIEDIRVERSDHPMNDLNRALEYAHQMSDELIGVRDRIESLQ